MDFGLVAFLAVLNLTFCIYSIEKAVAESLDGVANPVVLNDVDADARNHINMLQVKRQDQITFLHSELLDRLPGIVHAFSTRRGERNDFSLGPANSPNPMVQMNRVRFVAAIGGIWAKSHKKPHYITDEDVAEAAARIARTGPVDILITHGCPVGLADLTPSGRHGGQRCFLEANKTISPRLHLCGHLHVPQERTLKNGRRIINVGATPEGSIVVIEADPARGELEARLERWDAA